MNLRAEAAALSGQALPWRAESAAALAMCKLQMLCAALPVGCLTLQRNQWPPHALQPCQSWHQASCQGCVTCAGQSTFI